MKIESLTLKDFKRFDDLRVEFKNTVTNEIANTYVILGDNGSGKTTVLQAIALGLSMASGRIRKIADFDWIGWMPERYWRRGTPRIEMVIHFTDDEIDATREAVTEWLRVKGYSSGGGPIEPADQKVVEIVLEGDSLRIDGRATSDSPERIHPVRARRLAAEILGDDPAIRDLFKRLPGVFWFDQHRNLASTSAAREVASNGHLEQQPAEAVSYAAGVARLKWSLNLWQLQHLQATPGAGQVDDLIELENLYKRTFLDHSFADPEPMFRGGVPAPTDYSFMLSDGHSTYDLEEMSAGEQAAFPILYESVRQRFWSSIVLIDEIELNLHPPVAQGLVADLPHLGPRCQYIYTTHSDAVTSVVSPYEIHRLPGGRPCL